MNNEFKNEFKNINPMAIAKIINKCAGRDFLRIESRDFSTENACFIKHIENDGYGFWDIEWGWVMYNNEKTVISTGHFEHRIKLSPFRIDFENVNRFTPFSNQISKKQLEERLFILINKYCPHYKQAIIEETNKFINLIDKFSENNIEEKTFEK